MSVLKQSLALILAAGFSLAVASFPVEESDTNQTAESTATKQAPGSIGCGCCVTGGAAQTSPVILALDIDKDGVISASEIRNASQSLSALDANGDGNVDRREMHSLFGQPKISATRKTAGKPGQSAYQAGFTSDLFAQKMLQRDANGNGQLELSEMNHPTQLMLAYMDTNGDEILTYEELTEFRNGPKKSGKPRRRGQ